MHSSSSSGRSPESSSAELDGDHPSPALGLGALGSAWGTGTAPWLWQSLEELENPDPAQGAGTEFLCQNSCAEAKSFDFHESERVTQKHPGRKEGGGIPDTDLRQQTNSTFLSSYLGKRGRGALPQAGIGWNSAHGFSTFVPGAGKKMIVCTFCGAWDLFLNPLCHPLTLLPPLCHLLHPPTADFPLWEAQPGAASRISGRRRQGEPVPRGQPPVPRATNAFLAMDASPHGQSCGAQPCWEPRHP